MGLFSVFSRRPKVIDHVARRAHLLRFGRIVEGTVLEVIDHESGGDVAQYLYTINGVDFEASDLLTEEQRVAGAKYAPGAKVNVRFDPRNHHDSIIE